MVMILKEKFGPNQDQCCEKCKKLALSIDFFSYFAWGIHFKARISGNLRSIYLQITHLKDVRTKYLSNLGQKWQKIDYFQEFTLISQS